MDVCFESLSDLADAVNAWCAERGVRPMAGQTAERLTQRSAQYYRGLGLLDGPGPGRVYGEKHFLQLAGLRVLQARGLPLRRVQELLYGRTVEELRELRERAEAEQAPVFSGRMEFGPVETWRVVGLTPEISLLCRGGTAPSSEQIRAIRAVLSPKTRKPRKQARNKSHDQ